MSAVSATCRLHNYLIEVGAESCPRTFTEEDEWSLAVNGAVPFSIRDGVRVPLQIMDSGHHHDEDLTRTRRNRSRHDPNGTPLPREVMLQSVIDKNLRRPVR